MWNRISSIGEGSPGERAGLRVGDELVSIDGNRVTDVLDYMYYGYEERSEYEVQRDGETLTVTVEKEPGEDAGLEFETYLMDRPRSCANHCIFCFVDQLPRGLRETLYFKDDDVRLSFLTGSYITLTNMSEREIQRVIDLKISPINVSVHTTNPALRCRMLGNRNAGKGLEAIRRFAKAGIEMNCQIVCCPGVNDGRELERTMRDLAHMHPSVNSVSVIPVGLTRHREGLAQLTPFTRETAGETVRSVERFAERCLKRTGSRIFFCSDELYLKAGLEIPGEDFYEGYPQLENGVGLLRLLRSEFSEAVRDARMEGRRAGGTPFSIATGVAASGTMSDLLREASENFPGINGRVYAIENDFFGHSVDVAGLITGQDLTAQLAGRELGERVYITNRMLKEDEDIFLDDMSLSQASSLIGTPIIPMKNSGADLLSAMLI